MKAIIVVAVYCLTSANLIGQDRSVRPGRFGQSFMMQESQDGERVKHGFEMWTVSGEFSAARDPRCTIQVTSLHWLDEQTHIFNWLHESSKITEIRHGIFKVETNGRLNPFSGLEVVIEFSSDRTQILDVSGSMRAGTKGQSVSIFHVDRDSWNRKVPPVYNPSRKRR